MSKRSFNSLIAPYSTIKSMSIEWLWYPYIAFGKITIILGDPGEGKNSFVLYLISKLSNSNNTEIEFTKESIKIIYQSAEDGIEDTIKPRLELNGANCKNIFFITNNNINLSGEDLENAIIESKAKLLILDSFQSFLEKGMSIQNVTDLRPMFTYLTKIAKKNCAIVLVGHMNKANGTKDLYRGLGSIDIVAVARSVLTVKKLNDGSKTRIVSQIKNNLSEIGMPVAFDINIDGTIKWFGKTNLVEMDGSDAIYRKKEKYSSILLCDFLKDGPVLTSIILEEARKNEISERTIRKLKKDMNIIAIKRKESWYWSLREKIKNE